MTAFSAKKSFLEYSVCKNMKLSINSYFLYVHAYSNIKHQFSYRLIYSETLSCLIRDNLTAIIPINHNIHGIYWCHSKDKDCFYDVLNELMTIFNVGICKYI